MTLTRRRFLTIAATAALAATPVRALTEWRGMALGARARILIDHPEAAAITADAAAEIARLECKLAEVDPEWRERYLMKAARQHGL